MELEREIISTRQPHKLVGEKLPIRSQKGSKKVSAAETLLGDGSPALGLVQIAVEASPVHQSPSWNAATEGDLHPFGNLLARVDTNRRVCYVCDTEDQDCDTVDEGLQSLKEGHMLFDNPQAVTLSDSSSNDSSAESSPSQSMAHSSDGDESLTASETEALATDVQRKRKSDQLKEKHDATQPKQKVVDNNHVGPLVRAYWKHFGDFSKGRKQKVKQLIPAKVWEKIYVDYKAIFPNSKFDQETLKDHLRDTVKDMKSGINNPEEGDGATPQDPDMIMNLKDTPSWKARNILKIREGAMQGTNSPTGSIPEACQSAAPTRPTTPSTGPPDAAHTKPLTKRDSLKHADENLNDMMGILKSMQSEKNLDENSKKAESAARQAESAAMKKESEARSIFQEKQNVLAEITLLKEQRALDLITEDDFHTKCKAAFGLL